MAEMNPKSLPATIARLLRPAVLFLAIFLAGYLGYYVWLAITRSYPMEYREFGMVMNTQLLVEGKNPYGLEYRPVYVNVFGIGYQWVVYPFAKLFGSTFFIHRLVSVLFVLGSIGLLFWCMVRDNISKAFAGIGALTYFYFLSQGLSISARPDSAGTFFFLASIMVPYTKKFSSGSLVFSIVMGLLGFLTKSYFFVGLPLVALFLFLRVSKVRAIVFGGASAIALALTILVINAIYPCYFTEIFFTVLNSAITDVLHLKKTGSLWLQLIAGFIALLFLGLFVNRKTLFNRGKEEFIRIKGSRDGLLNFPLHFSVLTLVCMGLIMVFKLGLHSGNGIIYYHQFLTPFIIWAGLMAVRAWNSSPIPIALLLANLLYLTNTVNKLPNDHSKDWAKIANVMRDHKDIFHFPHVAHLIVKQGKPVYDLGLTEYHKHGRKNNFTSIAATYEEKGKEFRSMLLHKIQKRQFDLLLINDYLCVLVPFAEVEKYYRPIEILPAPMEFAWINPEWYEVQVWIPKERIK